MSHTLINRSIDLRRLQDEGYELEIRNGYLLLKNIPHVNENREVKRGILVSELTLTIESEKTGRPDAHDVWFLGDIPCDENGNVLNQIYLSSESRDFGGGVIATHRFSRRPPDGYADYHQKMTTYEAIISGPAQLVDPSATSLTFAISEVLSGDSVFKYDDTATKRAQIGAATDKLSESVVAIVGLGGTGSYILDLVSKTPVRAIHLFDGDRFLQHNAFRSPGAPSIETLKNVPNKALYFRDIYSKIRNDIFANGHIDESNVCTLCQMDFVFIAVDKGSARKLVADKLNAVSVPFIDVGMGVQEGQGSLFGQLRITTSTHMSSEIVYSTLPLVDRDGDDAYSRNIQIAELNALNAVLSVIKWKKTLGFYVDLEKEFSSIYQIDGNLIINEDKI